MAQAGGASRLRVGLVGAGAIGAWHARIVAERPDAVLAAVCDVDAARCREVAARHGATAFADAASMFAAGDLDAAIIASPESVHGEHVRLAAEAGVAMLIEKPVAVSVAEINVMAASLTASGGLAMAGHVERFELGSVQLKNAVAQGICGRIATIAARRQFVAADTPRFRGLSSTLRILAVHDFDLVAWVHPVPVTEVHAVAARAAVFDATGLDDHVVTTLRFADGALGLIESGWTLPLGYGAFSTPEGWSPAGNNRLDVFGSDGMVSNDMGLRSQQLVALDGSGFRAAGLKHQAELYGRVVGALAEEVGAFLRCVADGTPPPVTLDDARRAVALVEAAERSLATGLPVRLGM